MEYRFKIIDDIDKLLNKYLGKVRVYPYGSFRFETALRNKNEEDDLNNYNDLDLIVFCPQTLNIDTVINTIQKIEELDICVYKDAFVPLITFVYKEIDIDLIFAFVGDVKSNYVDIDISNLDNKTVLALNGYRTTEKICSVIPNMETFRYLLRSIKNWAKSLEIYSNKYCYMNGISLSIMAAYICMNNFKRGKQDLLREFFKVFANWNWNIPVSLFPITDTLQGHRSWNGNNPNDNKHHMKIITPLYPHINTTYNVTKSSSWLIQKYLKYSFQNFSETLNCPKFNEFDYTLSYPISIGTNFEHKFKSLICRLEKVIGISQVLLSLSKDSYNFNIVLLPNNTYEIDLSESVQSWLSENNNIENNFILSKYHN